MRGVVDTHAHVLRVERDCAHSRSLNVLNSEGLTCMDYEVVWLLRYTYSIWAAIDMIHSVFTQCMFGQLPGNTGSLLHCCSQSFFVRGGRLGRQLL